MDDIEKQIEKIANLLTERPPSMLELREMLLEIEEIISSPDFLLMPGDAQRGTQSLRRDIKTRIQNLEHMPDDGQSTRLPSPEPTQAVEEPGTPPLHNNISQADPGNRNSNAEEQMEEAERLFYSGRFSEAIKLFDRVLQIEPDWDRAIGHRSEAEEYLRTGYIPPVALPPDAASAFGKAQSAARVGRYHDALSLLKQAQEALREVGIQRWQEGLEFEQKLQENIDAEAVYQEGLTSFTDGNLDEAIERVRLAARATGLPKYSEKAQEFQKVKETVRRINETISAVNPDPKQVSQAKTDIDVLVAEYGDNPRLDRLGTRLSTAIPRVAAPLKEKTRAKKAQAERAATIEETLYLAQQAKEQLDQIRNLEGLDENLDRLQTEVDQLIRDVQQFENELSLATRAYENRKNWPAQASRISENVRNRYPDDPRVVQLNRSLSRYHLLRVLIKIGAVLLALGLFAGMALWVVGRYGDYQLSLTPTATATATTTPTTTSTSTPSPTPTITITPTASTTPTPTPIAGLSLRDVWARSGCYEGFNATGRIPAEGVVRFLPDQRRFDNFNRECVLVEYQGNDKSVIGWVLLMDLGSPNEITPTP